MSFLLNMSLWNGQPGYIAHQSEIESNFLIGHLFSSLSWSSLFLPPLVLSSQLCSLAFSQILFHIYLLTYREQFAFFLGFFNLQPHMAAHTFCLRIIVFRRQGHDKQQPVLFFFSQVSIQLDTGLLLILSLFNIWILCSVCIFTLFLTRKSCIKILFILFLNLVAPYIFIINFWKFIFC